MAAEALPNTKMQHNGVENCRSINDRLRAKRKHYIFEQNKKKINIKSRKKVVRTEGKKVHISRRIFTKVAASTSAIFKIE